MADLPLDRDRKRRILDDCGVEFLQEIVTSPIFMAELVRGQVITHEENLDIMAKQEPTRQRSALKNILYAGSILQFLTFCVVLHDKCNRGDIVTEVFGLKINQLKAQRDQLRTARLATTQDQSAPPGPQPQLGDATAEYTAHYSNQPQINNYSLPQPSSQQASHINQQQPSHIYQPLASHIHQQQPSLPQPHPVSQPWTVHPGHQTADPGSSMIHGSMCPQPPLPPHPQQQQHFYSHSDSSQSPQAYFPQASSYRYTQPSFHQYTQPPTNYYTQPPTQYYTQPNPYNYSQQQTYNFSHPLGNQYNQPWPSHIYQPQGSHINQQQPIHINQQQPSHISQPQPCHINQQQASHISQPQPMHINQPQGSHINQQQASHTSKPQSYPVSQSWTMLTGHPPGHPGGSTSMGSMLVGSAPVDSTVHSLAHPHSHPPPHLQQQSSHDTWGNPMRSLPLADGISQSPTPSVPGGLQPGVNVPGTQMVYQPSTHHHNTQQPPLHTATPSTHHHNTQQPPLHTATPSTHHHNTQQPPLHTATPSTHHHNTQQPPLHTATPSTHHHNTQQPPLHTATPSTHHHNTQQPPLPTATPSTPHDNTQQPPLHTATPSTHHHNTQQPPLHTATPSTQHQDTGNQQADRDYSLKRPSAASTPSTSSLMSEHQLPMKKRKGRREVHHCSVRLEVEFDAGDGDSQTREYISFVSRIGHAIKVTLQAATRKNPDVSVRYINQKKRMVFLEIKSPDELSQMEIQEALLSDENELTRNSLYIGHGTVQFRDDITIALVWDIVQKRHIPDMFGRTVDFDTQYVMLKILSQRELRTVRRDELERPDKYQYDLQQRGSRDITEEELVAPGEARKCVLVRGRAGIGKTTLIMCLLWKWAHGQWGSQFKAIFLLNLRHMMAVKGNMSLTHLLSMFATYSTGQHGTSLQDDWLVQSQRQIVFVLDGLDEVANFWGKWHESYDCAGRKEASALFWALALMKRMCLQKSTLIITSRPFSGLDCIKPTMMVEVMGLTRDRVLVFVEKNVKPDRVTMVKETLTNNPILLSISSITFYCAALCRVLESEVGVTDKLTTYTQITAYVIEKGTSHSSLLPLTRLAYNGLMKREHSGLAQLVFDQEDFNEQQLQQEHVDAARRSGIFLQTEVSNTSGKKQVLGEFVHLSIQEFLAMIGLLTQGPAEVKEALKMLSSSGQFNMALLFLYGFAFNTSSEAIKRLCTAMGVQIEVGEEMCSILKDNIKGDDDLQMLQMAHESQSSDIARLVGKSRFKQEVKLRRTKMTVVDILALTFLLRHHHSATSLVLEEVGLDDVSMKELSKLLKSNTTVTHLNIEDSQLSNLMPLVCAILQTRSVTTLTITPAQSSKVVLETSETMTNLSIQQESVADEDLKALHEDLASCSSLKDLQIRMRDVTDEGVKILTDIMRTQPLTKLRVDCWYLTDVTAQSLAQALKENITLTYLAELDLYHVTEAGIKLLSEALEINTTVQELSVSMSPLTILGYLKASDGSLHQQLLDHYRKEKGLPVTM